ncbi:MAG: HEAT repeat domain-containing protein, partial [Candidatus Sericytochromatia bacterium]
MDFYTNEVNENNEQNKLNNETLLMNKKFSELNKLELDNISKNVLDILVDALNDTHGNIREMAASALGELGDIRAVDYLIKSLVDPNPEVRRNAAGALGKLKDPSCIDA